MRIILKSLSKSFGSRRCLDEISLTLEPGQIVVLLGANGAGKTTLLRSLAGIVAPDEGEILYDGELFKRDRMDLRKRFFIQPDFPYIYTTQILELAEAFSDRACILHQGRIHAFGTMAELRDRASQTGSGTLETIFGELHEVR